MASSDIIVDSTAYQAVTAADSVIQNTSAYPVRWIASTTLPDVDATEYHTLQSGQALLKSGDLPSGTIYARAEFEGRDVKIVYSV